MPKFICESVVNTTASHISLSAWWWFVLREDTDFNILYLFGNFIYFNCFYLSFPKLLQDPGNTFLPSQSHSPPNFLFPLFQKNYQVQFALSNISWVWRLLWGVFVLPYDKQKVWFSLSQQLSNTNNSSSRGRTLCPPRFPHAEIFSGLSSHWSYACGHTYF